MKPQMNPSTNWVPVMLGGLAVAAVMAIAFLAMNKPEVAGEIGILLEVFTGIMALGAYTTITAREPGGQEEKLSVEAAAAAAIAEAIEWTDSVPVTPGASTKLRVTNVHGACAHGYLPGNTWVVDSQGNLSRPICAAAANAFKAMYYATGMETPEEFACERPIGDRKVIFELQSM